MTGDGAHHEAPRVVAGRSVPGSSDARRRIIARARPVTRRGPGIGALAGLLVVLPIAVGVLAGPVAETLLTPQYRASAVIDLQQDPPALGGTEGASAELRDRFVQGEVIVIQAPDLLAEARGQEQEGTSLVARQVGITDAVEVEVTAPGASEAVATANRVVELYTSRRSQAFDERAGRRTATLEQQLAALETESPPGADDATAVVSEYARLTAALNDVRLAAASFEGSTVISAATIHDASRTGSALRRGVLAGLATLVLAIGAVVLLRTSRHRVQGVEPARRS